jgi:alkaline phosphatase D
MTARRRFTLLAALIVAATSPAKAASADDPLVVKRLGIIGCLRQQDPVPALDRYVAAKPDVVLWVGDNVYADTEDDPSHIERCYAALEQKPGFKQLRDQSTFLAVWDDHDYGLNDDGMRYKLKKASHGIFRRFWRHEQRVPSDRPGVFHSQIFGEPGKRCQVIMLDGRFNREDPGDASDTLGEPQWAWLAEELRKPADLRFIVSGYQVLLDRETKFETWAKFPGTALCPHSRNACRGCRVRCRRSTLRRSEPDEGRLGLRRRGVHVRRRQSGRTVGLQLLSRLARGQRQALLRAG